MKLKKRKYLDFIIIGVIAGLVFYSIILYSGETSPEEEKSVLDAEVTQATYIYDSPGFYLVVMEITNKSDEDVAFFPERFKLRFKTVENDIVGYFKLEEMGYEGYVDHYIFSSHESASFMGGFDSYSYAEESDAFPYELTLAGKIVSGNKERFVKDTFSGETITRTQEKFPPLD